jgi:hypothetical protein
VRQSSGSNQPAQRTSRSLVPWLSAVQTSNPKSVETKSRLHRQSRSGRVRLGSISWRAKGLAAVENAERASVRVGSVARRLGVRVPVLLTRFPGGLLVVSADHQGERAHGAMFQVRRKTFKIDDLPVAIYQWKLPPAGILVGRDPAVEITHRNLVTYWQPPKGLGQEFLQTKGDTKVGKFYPEPFLQLLAKVGYSFGAAAFGPQALMPEVADLILTKHPRHTDYLRFIGTDELEEPCRPIDFSSRVAGRTCGARPGRPRISIHRRSAARISTKAATLDRRRRPSILSRSRSHTRQAARRSSFCLKQAGHSTAADSVTPSDLVEPAPDVFRVVRSGQTQQRGDSKRHE